MTRCISCIRKNWNARTEQVKKKAFRKVTFADDVDMAEVGSNIERSTPETGKPVSLHTSSEHCDQPVADVVMSSADSSTDQSYSTVSSTPTRGSLGSAPINETEHPLTDDVVMDSAEPNTTQSPVPMSAQPLPDSRSTVELEEAMDDTVLSSDLKTVQNPTTSGLQLRVSTSFEEPLLTDDNLSMELSGWDSPLTDVSSSEESDSDELEDMDDGTLQSLSGPDVQEGDTTTEDKSAESQWPADATFDNARVCSRTHCRERLPDSYRWKCCTKCRKICRERARLKLGMCSNYTTKDYVAVEVCCRRFCPLRCTSYLCRNPKSLKVSKRL